MIFTIVLTDMESDVVSKEVEDEKPETHVDNPTSWQTHNIRMLIVDDDSDVRFLLVNEKDSETFLGKG